MTSGGGAGATGPALSVAAAKVSAAAPRPLEPAVPDVPPPDADICFIDVETTSLAEPWVPHGRRVWEFAGARLTAATGDVTRLHLVISDVSLADAVEKSLTIGGFYQRHPNAGGTLPATARYLPEAAAAQAIAQFTAGAWLSGANVGFDQGSLAEMLVRHRAVDPLDGDDPFPWWHHPYDVLAYAAGAAGMVPPWSSRTVAERVGVARDAAGPVHSAAADAEWCLLVHQRLRAARGGDDVFALAAAVQRDPA